jgi:hypothetical protein
MNSAHMVNIMVIGHGTEVEKSGVTIGLFDPFHFTGHGFQGFVPGDPFKFTPASFPGPLQRIKETVGRVKPLAVSPSPGAPPGCCAVIIIIILDPNNSPVFNMHLHFAKAAAVAIANGADDLFGFVLTWGHFPTLLLFSFHQEMVFLPNICVMLEK